MIKTKEEKTKKKISAAFDFFKTVLIYLLTASMLIFAGVYINNLQNIGQISEIPWEKRSVFEIGGAVIKSEINENHIDPLQITVTVENNSFTYIYSNNLISDIYDGFVKYSIRGIFNKNSECQRLGKEEGEKLWSKCAKEENSVYIKYAGNYLYPVIYAFLDKTWDIRDSADAFSNNKELAMVHELFIVDEAPVYGVAKDIDGNISVFMPETDTGIIIKGYINTPNLLAYNNIAGVIPCELLKGGDINSKTGSNGNNIKNLAFPETFHLSDNHSFPTYSPELKFSNPVIDEENNINTEQNIIKDLFKILNFNIESSLPYSDTESITFVDEKNTVSFSDNGRIIYSCSNSPGETGGIHLSKFLGYDADYTFYEKIKAASVFAGSIDRGLTGNECNIYLKNITADSNGSLTIIFSYYYEGINIKINGRDEGIVVAINQNSITEVKINSLYLSSQGIKKNMNPIVILGGMDEEISRDISDNNYKGENYKEDIARKYKLVYDKIKDKFIVNGFELIYNINYADNGGETNNTVQAFWGIK